MKRYVEPDASTPSSSDDESLSPVSQDRSHVTDDSQLEVCTLYNLSLNFLMLDSHNLIITVLFMELYRIFALTVNRLHI